MYENAVFDVFLTGNQLFRRTDPIQAFATIAFSPFHAAFPTVTSLHAYLPERLQNAIGRHTGYICTDPCQEALHQHGKSRLLRFFPRLHLQGFIHPGQQRSPFAVGQKPGVAHHLEMARRNVADIASAHLFLAQRLAFMLPRTVIAVVMNHRAATIVSQAGSRHRRSLQVAAGVFHSVPGIQGLLRKVHLPVPAILSLRITAPLALIADVAKTRPHAGHAAIVAAAQQADNGCPPDGLHGLLFKEEASLDAVLNVDTVPRDGDVDMRVLIELTAVSVQGAEYTWLNALSYAPTGSLRGLRSETAR